jgi:hypothetical protein
LYSVRLMPLTIVKKPAPRAHPQPGRVRRNSTGISPDCRRIQALDSWQRVGKVAGREWTMAIFRLALAVLTIGAGVAMIPAPGGAEPVISIIDDTNFASPSGVYATGIAFRVKVGGPKRLPWLNDAALAELARAVLMDALDRRFAESQTAREITIELLTGYKAFSVTDPTRIFLYVGCGVADAPAEEVTATRALVICSVIEGLADPRSGDRNGLSIELALYGARNMPTDSAQGQQAMRSLLSGMLEPVAWRLMP